MKYIKTFIPFFFIFFVILSCSNVPTSSSNGNLKLKNRAGRYSLDVNFTEDITLDFVVFDSGYINFIGKKNNIANNIGSYYLGDPESTNKTFSFDIKETINGVAPDTYFIDFFGGKLRYSQNKEVNFKKLTDSTNIKMNERIGIYYSKDKSANITITDKQILWSYFPDAYIDIANPYSEETSFSRTQTFTNSNGVEHSFTVSIVFNYNSIKLKFTITDPDYSQYNKEEEYRIVWENNI
ncbi:hypothetical protein [uncultured Brachyspira sp.]|uniref:hypothetical protein n=1 Tax=uncultured Brachyspira sp. TaxID=221953 RepID=UPI002610F5E0|nr:hypothetical protein [uncultured Brachyspira sp.]